jgi:CheY-like chemotaxis protein/signal recognition particle receptor subunit beta
MALFNHATREVTVKLVYYGPALAGKTTNLQWIHDNLVFKTKGRLVSLATHADRTLFFDFLPAEVGPIRGMRTRLQIYTVPGQVSYEATRRVVLKGCDAVVFVADSQAAMLDANVETVQGLRRNLLANEIDPSIPMVLQYNKRDMPTALPVAVLNARLNPRALPFFEAVALTGAGVEETLQGATGLVFRSLSTYYGEGEVARFVAPTVVSADTAGRVSRHVPDEGEPAEAAAAPPAAPESGAAAVFRDATSAEPPNPAEPSPKGEGLRPDQWLYLLEGSQHGPVDVDELIDLVLTSIPEDTRVWHPGLEGWVRANQIRQISEEIPPPLPDAARGAEVEEDMPDFDTVPAMLRTVLIADEDEGFRRFLGRPLAARGFTIFEAADGAAAWQLAVQNRPWIILADVSMPELDGFEFCRRVRSHPLLSRKPLLFISASDRYRERYRALQIGADDFLSKQMPIRELLMRIQLLMTRYSDLNASGDPRHAGGPAPGALEGRVEVFGAPALLQICNQGRLSGLFVASAEDAEDTEAVFGFREGEIISATTGSRKGPEAVYAFLGWQNGSFRFRPGNPVEGQPLAQSVEHLLLEGCRLLDEARGAGSGEGEP